MNDMNVKIENFIGIYENAFSKEYCDSVIKYFDEAEKAGMTIDRQQDRGVSKIQKNDLQLYGHSAVSLKYVTELIKPFSDVFWNYAYSDYSETFAILKSHAPHSNYAFKVQKTEVGQGYHLWHAEDCNRESCNRVLVWTLYLNDVEEGGETEFLYYPKRIKPKTGTLIIWPAGFTHTHRGNPPISNTKYIITGWVEF